MKCFYHNDMDGKCAGAIVHRSEMKNPETLSEYISINYNQPFPFESIRLYERVFIVDY